MQEYFRNREPVTDIEISPLIAVFLIIGIAIIIAFIKSFFLKKNTTDDDFDPDIFED